MKEGKKRNIPLDPEEDTHTDDEETLVAKLRKCLCKRRSKLRRSRRRTGGSSPGKEIEALRY